MEIKFVEVLEGGKGCRRTGRCGIVIDFSTELRSFVGISRCLEVSKGFNWKYSTFDIK